MSTRVGICRGCQIERRLDLDGTVKPHRVPVHLQAIDGEVEWCDGSSRPPAGVDVPVPVDEPTPTAQVARPAAARPIRTDGWRSADAAIQAAEAVTEARRSRTRQVCRGCFQDATRFGFNPDGTLQRHTKAATGHRCYGAGLPPRMAVLA